MTHTISSQRYLDDDTVESKRSAKDYVVTVTPDFEIDGETYRAIIDGHHSLAAAELDGVDPTYVIASVREDDRIALLSKSIDDYLSVCYVDRDWYDVETNLSVF